MTGICLELFQKLLEILSYFQAKIHLMIVYKNVNQQLKQQFKHKTL